MRTRRTADEQFNDFCYLQRLGGVRTLKIYLVCDLRTGLTARG